MSNSVQQSELQRTSLPQLQQKAMMQLSTYQHLTPTVSHLRLLHTCRLSNLTNEQSHNQSTVSGTAVMRLYRLMEFTGLVCCICTQSSHPLYFDYHVISTAFSLQHFMFIAAVLSINYRLRVQIFALTDGDGPYYCIGRTNYFAAAGHQHSDQ